MRVYRVLTGSGVGWDIGELSFAPDSRRLAAIGRTRNAVRWLDLSSGEVIRELTFDLTNTIALALSPDHSFLGVGRDTGLWPESVALVERYELPNPNPAHTWELEPYIPYAAACVPDGSGFAVALSARGAYPYQEGVFPYAVCGWDGRTGNKVEPVSMSRMRSDSLAFSPDGRWLASARDGVRGGRVLVLDWPSGNRVGEFTTLQTRRIRFAPNRPLLAVTARKSVVVYDLPTVLQEPRRGTPPRVATLQRGHRDRVTDVAFAPSGEQLLTVSMDTTARVWSLAKKRCVRCFEWGIGPLTATAWSADGTLCAAAGEDGQIVVWDAEE